MKYFQITFVAMIATMMLFCSCSAENLLATAVVDNSTKIQSTSSDWVDVTVALPNKGRGWDVAKYSVTASKDGEDDVTEQTTTSSLTMRLKLGDWSFVAKAYDSNNNVIYQSASSTHTVSAVSTSIQLLLDQQSAVMKIAFGGSVAAAVKALITKVEVVATPDSAVKGFETVTGTSSGSDQVIFLKGLLANAQYSLKGSAYIGDDIVYLNTNSVSKTPNTSTEVYDAGSLSFSQIKITPVSFSQPSGSSFSTDTKISLSCATTGVKYYYTLDGTTPTTSSTLYNGTTGIKVTSDWIGGKTVKVIAVPSSGTRTPSEVAVATYTYNAGLPATPSFSKAGGTYSTDISVVITNNESSGTLKYSFNGTSWSNYTSAINISGDGTTKTLYAKVVDVTGKNGDESGVISQTYMISYDKLGAISITPAPGAYFSDQKFTLEAPLAGADIYYTTDGTAPTTSSTKYTAPFSLTAKSTAYTIKAICVKAGYTNSEVNNLGSYTIINGSAVSFSNAKNLIKNSDAIWETNGTVSIAKGENWFVATGLASGSYEIKWLKSGLTPTITIYKNNISTSVTATSGSGKYTFTASGTTSDRYYINFNSTATCEKALIGVGAANSIKPVTAVAISPSSVSDFYPGSKQKFTVTYTPSNANFGTDYTWTVGNSSVLSISGDTVTALASGSTTLKVSTLFTSGPSKSMTISVGSNVTLTATVPDWVWSDSAVIKAWVWGDSDEGSWISVTKKSNTSLTVSVLFDTTGFLLVRCVSGTSQPDWGIASGDAVGRIYNQTENVDYELGTTTYDTTGIWKTYGIQTMTLNLTVQDWIWGDSAEVSVWAWNASDEGAWYDVTKVSATAATVVLPEGLVGFKLVRCSAGHPHDWGNVWNETGNITIISGVTSYTATF